VHTSWLPGGAAKGLESSARPITQESKQGGGEVPARGENLELLKAIAASSVFTEFERAFTGATGLPVSLKPVQSFQLFFHGAKNEGPFCALLAQENRTCGACLQMQAQLSAAAKERAHTTICYAGLCETVVPLRLGNRLVGFLGTGQVFLRKPSQRQFQRTLSLLTGWEVHFDQDSLREAYFGTRIVPSRQHTAAVKLLEIFAEYLAMQTSQILIQRDNAEPPIITKAKEFIREHHTEDLSLPQVAQFANTSRFHFCKLFKRTTGLTFTKFLSHVRIESSKNLLINPQLRVSEVAYEVGFQSLTHFNRVFQKILGQSPTEYRLKVHVSKKPA
jgi:AraC-like DNA-binding protein/ligand-binding sensor protein